MTCTAANSLFLFLQIFPMEATDRHALAWPWCDMGHNRSDIL